MGNLISGLILPMDKSIRLGELIVIGESYGSVESLGARYVSVSTRNGIEIPYPQRDLHLRTPEVKTIEDVKKLAPA